MEGYIWGVYIMGGSKGVLYNGGGGGGLYWVLHLIMGGYIWGRVYIIGVF